MPPDTVALLSGGAGNLGHAVARLFADDGVAVVIADVAEEAGTTLAAELRRGGARAEFVRTDVTNAADWERAVRVATDRFGRVDCLVNAAGLSPSAANPGTANPSTANPGTANPGAASDAFGLDGWDSLLAVNLTAAFLGIRSTVPVMRAQRSGAIVNVSSIGGLVGLPVGHIAYAAAKGGLAALSRTVAARFGRDGIRSNTVFPGVLPPMRSRSAPAAGTSAAAVVRRSALGRVGDPVDVAHAVVFLASDHAAFITGADLVVDGGAISVAGLDETLPE